MRIIAGSLGGRNFISTSKSAHPMSEKMRGALFNILGDINGLNVLDVFSGSGAISFEAISRGAKSSIAIESNKIAQKDIENNIRALDLSNKVKLIKSTINSWLQANMNEKFNIIICDPPYDCLQLETISTLGNQLLRNGILVLSLPPKHDPYTLEGLEFVSEKDYGDSTLVFYRNNK